MHLPTTTTFINLLFLTTTSLQVLASPLSFTDIERRWSAGESDASIHASHNPGSASPAWPLALTSRSSSEAEYSSSGGSGDGSFAESYDAVTQRGVIGRRNVESSALSAWIRDFASRLLRSKGEWQMIAERNVVGDEDAAPVLRPGKVRYTFSS